MPGTPVRSFSRPRRPRSRAVSDAVEKWNRHERDADPGHGYWHRLIERVNSPSHGLGRLDDAEKCYWAVGCLWSEVNLGGFEKYFFDPCGSTYRDAVKGLQEMSARDCLRTLQQAKRLLFGLDEVPVDLSERRRRMSTSDSLRLCRRLDELDEAFCQDRDGLGERSRRFARGLHVLDLSSNGHRDAKTAPGPDLAASASAA